MSTVIDTLKVIFFVFAGIGGLFLLVAPIAGVIALIDSFRERKLRQTPVCTVAGLLASMTRPRRVVVRGARSVVGPAAPCRAPLSGMDCLWFRLELSRSDKISTETGDDWEHTEVWSSESGDTVWFSDGTGVVPVDVSLLAKPVTDSERGPIKRTEARQLEPDERVDIVGIRHFMRPGPRTASFLLTEDVVPAGATVTLYARPVDRDGVLVLAADRGFPNGVTTRELDAFTGEVKEQWWGVRMCLAVGAVAYLCGMGGALLTDLLR